MLKIRLLDLWEQGKLSLGPLRLYSVGRVKIWVCHLGSPHVGLRLLGGKYASWYGGLMHWVSAVFCNLITRQHPRFGL